VRFGRIATQEAEGAILAHSIHRDGIRFKKGRVLDAEDVSALLAAGIDSLVAARLEADEYGEDAAAERVARAVRGGHIVSSAPFTGRCNLYADAAGLLVYDVARLDAVNLVDEAITIAALPPWTAVEPRQMVATVKIIPYGVAASKVDAAVSAAGASPSLLSVAPFVAMRAGLVQTGVDTVNVRVLDKTRRTAAERLERLGSRLVAERRCRHHEEEVARCLQELVAEGCDLLLVAGASATADRGDVVPAGIEAAGGVVRHLGMPVEPGNLLVLADLPGGHPVICLPGCARSPALNGFDWVLERLAARLPVSREDIMRMGAGGLIRHGGRRGQDRETGADEALARRPRIGVVVLAAGEAPDTATGRESTLNRVVCAARASQAEAIVVVAGADADKARASIAGQEAIIVENPAYREGLSTSLRSGLSALPADMDGAAICLGDMQDLTSSDIDRLVAAFSEKDSRLICVATHRGHRTHPVLWARRFFPELEQVRGEGGAREVLERHARFVCEVEMREAAGQCTGRAAALQ